MMDIATYLTQEKKIPSPVAKRLAAKFERHPDILAELEAWIKTGRYEDGVQVEGYAATAIHDLAPFLDGPGVFSFLVTLRENPETAKRQIAEGFPRK